ncbi:hypothetical protein [Enterocloster lavalensis]|uniref:hypothetical protein n=1 Tax=Enterocloster lavalensis TaxID=460384 RepID=UPI003AB957E4
MLNFTSTTNPGNGVIGGKQWTGRTLCALLYAVSLPGYAVSVREYYGIPYNRHDVRNTGVCLYTPGILIVKIDTNIPKKIPDTDWCKMDIK